MRNNLNRRFTACCLILALMLSCAACGGERATSMHLLRTVGEVGVENEAGKDVEATEDMKLHDGYRLDTEKASYAWIELDRTKLAKMDEASEIEIEKKGGDLTIRLRDGSIFFHVTEPLGDDETMKIRTSTMAIGIRGTCGWVSADRDTVTVGLLEGKVECTPVGGKAVTVEAGWKAVLTESGEITVTPLTEGDIPSYIRGEADTLLEEALQIGQGMLQGSDGTGGMSSADSGDSTNNTENSDDTGDGSGGLDASYSYELPSELDDGIERTIIEVATRSEMVALRNQDLSNTEIHLTADAYDLGDSIFVVMNAVNLRIIGNPSTTISGGRNGAGSIFFAKDCENLLLYQIEFGNQYDGDVTECVSLSRCNNAHIDNCTFFNAMRGLNGAGSDAIVNGCEIRDCVEGSLYWDDGTLTLMDCTFHDNGTNSARYDDAPMFKIRTSTLQLIRCGMYDNACVTYCATEQVRDIYGNYSWVLDSASSLTETDMVSEGNLWDTDTP